MSNQRFEFDAPEGAGYNVRLLYITRSVYEGDWHSTPHSHHYTEFFYVLSGSGKFQVEGSGFKVAPGDMIIINPNVEHTELGIPKSPLEYIVIGMEGGDFILDGSSDPRYTAFKCGAAGRQLLHHMEEMIRELEQRKEFYQQAAQYQLELFLIHLLRYKQITVLEQPTLKTSRECANVKRYIDTHYDDNLTLDVLADIAHLNKYYLVHAFTREIGTSPISYLNNRRIEESRYFLENTNYSVSQISQILGFSSPSYFSQCFRRSQGQSPKAYRIKALEQGEN